MAKTLRFDYTGAGMFAVPCFSEGLRNLPRGCPEGKAVRNLIRILERKEKVSARLRK